MNRRTLALIVLVLAVIYLTSAAISLYLYFDIAKAFASYGIPVTEQATIQTIVRLRNSYLRGFVMLALAGVPTLSVALGLYVGNVWARKAWLVLVLILSFFHALRLVFDHSLEPVWIGERVLEVVGIGLLAVISWGRLYLTDSSFTNAAS